MNQTLNLYRLQQTDSQIDKLRIHLEDIQKTLDDDTELCLLEKQVQFAEGHHKDAEQTLLQSEEIVQRQHIKIQQTQSDLYEGKSHSPKELQDLQNDVAALKRHLVVLEDSQIEAMIACESAETALQTARAKLRSALEYRAKDGKNLHHEQDVLRNDLERYLVERKAVAVAIPESDLDFYNRLRKEHRGIAVAVISESSCGACGSNLSRAQIQSVHSANEMALCPSCGRILYGS